MGLIHSAENEKLLPTEFSLTSNTLTHGEVSFFSRDFENEIPIQKFHCMTGLWL